MFDKYLAILKPSESVIMMIIFRQTLGWKHPETGKRKMRDWISQSQFQKKSGLSDKTITQAIQCLVEKRLILVTDHYGYELKTTESRRGKTRIFYGPYFKSSEKFSNNNRNSYE